jgi:hypothetical protein
MGWNQMHWEKIPGQLDKDILKRQLDEATKEDIPIRCMRIRRKEDGRNTCFMSGLLSQVPVTAQ